MDLTQYRSKLIGDKEERAVSPVIGVILMVAITVILAAVIAAFVLDLGQGQSANAQAGINMENNTNGNVEVTVNSVERADKLRFESDCSDGSGSSGFDTTSKPPSFDSPSAGDSGTINCGSTNDATIRVIGVYDGSENVITTFEK